MADLKPVDETPSVLLIAGIDSSGGAGLSVDTAVVRRMGLHALPVTAAVTAQNTRGVTAVHVTPGDVVRAQLDAVSAEFPLSAVKVGMLGSEDNAQTVAAWLQERPRLPVVVDPVLRATSGGVLAPGGVPQVIKSELLPRATVLTPNLQELAEFSGVAVTAREHVPAAARAVLAQGCRWVLVTGGHLRGPLASDYLCGETELWLEGDRSEHPQVRGTGCALSTALACGLARGEAVVDAAWAAKSLVSRGLDRSYVSGEDRHLLFD